MLKDVHNSAVKAELENKSKQWCEYDRLARMDCKRERDRLHMVEQAGIGVGEMMKLIYKEEWRIEQEVCALSKIARQDSNMLMSGRQSIGAAPGGQLLWEGGTSELVGVEEEELGTVYNLATGALQANIYNANIGTDDGIWKGTIDHKPEVATSAQRKIESLLTASGAYDPLLFRTLHDMSQLIHLCEINMRRKRMNKPHATHTDPFIYCCDRMAQHRKRWLSAAEAVISSSSMNASCLVKIRKASVTLQKIQAFRQAHNTKHHKQPPIPPGQGRETQAAGSEADKQVTFAASKATPPPQPSAHSSRAPSPHLPSLASNPNPRTITPSTLEAVNGMSRKADRPKRVTMSRPVAVYRLQRWWRRVGYWRRVTRSWISTCRREGLLEDARYRQQLQNTIANRDLTTLPMMCAAAVTIQKVFRGWREGRKPRRARLLAVATLQRMIRGTIVRQYTMPVLRDLLEVAARKKERQLVKAFMAEDARVARPMREYAEAVINLETELRIARKALSDEETHFKKEWKAWEENMTRVCLTEVPLDSEWVAQTQPDGSKQYLNLKTKRVTTEHPNLKLAEIHRKRQWVKVTRVRSEHRSSIQANITQLEDALERIKLEAQSTILSERKQLVYSL